MMEEIAPPQGIGPEGPGFVMYRGYSRDEAEKSVGEGWRPLIRELFKYLAFNPRPWGATKVADEVKIIQVKEKFGLLRIYHTGGNLYTEGLICGIEVASGAICECCGHPGTLRSAKADGTPRNWTLTLCDECNALSHPMSRTS